MVGQKFGNLTVVKQTKERRNGYIVYICFCNCGTKCKITSSSLKKGTKSCGCLKKRDITGKKYNSLTVIKETDQRDSCGRIKWLCTCDCGNNVTTTLASLRSGDRKSCGCKRKKEKPIKIKKPRYHNLIEKRFGNLTVTELAERDKNNKVRWKCKCDCGKYKIVRSSYLLNGDTKSCGCLKPKALNKEDKYYISLYNRYEKQAKKRNYTFNLSFNEFKKLIHRHCYYCNNILSNTYNLSNGKTILYNGIDRLDNNLGYSIENCVPCCCKCNRAKMNMSYKEFIEMIIKIYKNLPLDQNQQPYGIV